jgi:hypothetical protein
MAMVLVLTVLIAASEFSSQPPTSECCDDHLSLPLMPPNPGYVQPLSNAVPIYDFVRQAGHRNIGAWIDAAALRVGR